MIASRMARTSLGIKTPPMRRLLTALGALATTVSLLVGCTSSAAAPRGARTPAAQQAPVLVLLVVDQFSAWVAEERLPTLPEDGGFRRLAREGMWIRALDHGYAVTDTAPGHARIATGAPPAESGIFANEVLTADGDSVSILRDDGTRLVTPSGVLDRPGSSLARLRVPTLADRLRERAPDSVIVSLSLKDRGALFGGGRRPDAVLWFEPAVDSFVTSTAFADGFPEWARAEGSTEAIAARRLAPWTLGAEELVRTHCTRPDDAPGEGDLDGWGTTFPHDFARARSPAKAFRASPAGDEALFALAEDAIDALHRRDRAFFLHVSLSSYDYVGHLFGPDSFEAWDELVRLDRSLAGFLDVLDRRFGAGGYALLLTADHGSSFLPEDDLSSRSFCAPGANDPFERPCGGARRVSPDALASTLEGVADATLGEGRWVLGVSDPYVVLTDAARALPAARYRLLVEALVRALVATPGIRDAFDTSDASALASRSDAIRRAVRPEGGDLFAVLDRGAFFDPQYVPGFGSGHGSSYAHDRRIPLFGLLPEGFPVDLVLRPGRAIPDSSLVFGLADRLLGGDGRR